MFLCCKKFPKLLNTCRVGKRSIYSSLYKARSQCRRRKQAGEQWKKGKEWKTASLSAAPPRFSRNFWVSWKSWIYENHICELRPELRSEQLYEGRSSQLYAQLLRLRKERLDFRRITNKIINRIIVYESLSRSSSNKREERERVKLHQLITPVCRQKHLSPQNPYSNSYFRFLQTYTDIRLPKFRIISKAYPWLNLRSFWAWAYRLRFSRNSWMNRLIVQRPNDTGSRIVSF